MLGVATVIPNVAIVILSPPFFLAGARKTKTKRGHF